MLAVFERFEMVETEATGRTALGIEVDVHDHGGAGSDRPRPLAGFKSDLWDRLTMYYQDAAPDETLRAAAQGPVS